MLFQLNKHILSGLLVLAIIFANIGISEYMSVSFLAVLLLAGVSSIKLACLPTAFRILGVGLIFTILYAITLPSSASNSELFWHSVLSQCREVFMLCLYLLFVSQSKKANWDFYFRSANVATFVIGIVVVVQFVQIKLGQKPLSISSDWYMLDYGTKLSEFYILGYDYLRPSAFFSEPSVVAAVFVPMLYVYLNLQRYIFSGMLIFCIMILGSVYGLLFSSLIVLYFFVKNYKSAKVTSLVTLALILVLFIYYYNPSRVINIFDGQDESYKWRFVYPMEYILDRFDNADYSSYYVGELVSMSKDLYSASIFDTWFLYTLAKMGLFLGLAWVCCVLFFTRTAVLWLFVFYGLLSGAPLYHDKVLFLMVFSVLIKKLPEQIRQEKLMLVLSYFSAFVNILFGLLCLPILARQLEPNDWIAYTFVYSSIYIFISLDLGANLTLGRGVAGHISYFVGNLIKHLLLAPIILLLLTAYMLSKSSMGYTASLLTTWVALGFITYISFILAYSLNGLKKNKKVSYSVLIGSSIRLFATFLVVLLNTKSYAVCISILILSYFLEMLINSVYICKYLTDKKINYIESLPKSADTWVLFFKNAILLSGGAILSQIDKLLLVGKLPNEEYSSYFLIVSFTQFPLLAQYPLQRYILPRYEAIINDVKFKNLSLLILFYICLWAVFISVTPYLLSIWYPYLNINKLEKIIFLCAFGSFFISVYSYIQTGLVRYGKYNLIAYINYFCIFLSLIILNTTTGMIAGGIAYFAAGLTQLILGIVVSYILYRRNAWKS